MYNTIEVIRLEIKNAQIKYFKKDGFTSFDNENVQHIKVLPYLSIVQSIEGSYDITLGNGETQKTGEGGFFIASSGVQQTIVHHVSKTTKQMRCRWLFIDVEINNAYKIDALYNFPTLLSEQAKSEMNKLFNELFSTDDFWENYGCAYKILGLALKNAQSVQNKNNQSVQDSVDYMMKNHNNPISVSDLSKIANMSESNFYTAFKKHFGVSPIAYLNHYRLSRAVDLMGETNSTISEISYQVGIPDPLYFSKLFKKTYGISPKQYRKQNFNR